MLSRRRRPVHTFLPSSLLRPEVLLGRNVSNAEALQLPIGLDVKPYHVLEVSVKLHWALRSSDIQRANAGS